MLHIAAFHQQGHNRNSGKETQFLKEIPPVTPHILVHVLKDIKMLMS